ncbi:hypothetical protein FRC16_001134 [Serendipita sp. 398]|nr:hypothetical protein FRC16_001134 [Serendipita sp. 398]
MRDDAHLNKYPLYFITSETLSYIIIDNQIMIGNLKVPVGDFLTDFLALIRTEGQSISTGLKTLLGNGDERVLGESSEVIE